MKELLKLAENSIIKQSPPVSAVKGDSIISSEEHQEISKEIDRLTGQSRINVTPDLFRINAARNGVLFPLLVNLAAVVILGGGIFATKYYFDVKDQEMVVASTEQQSAEGNLIKEIKKETEQRLAEKENEITEIQANMQKIESEREALEQDMNSKISEREVALQRELEDAIAAEREKLQLQGMSVEQIDQQIARLELEQAAIFEQELEGFREEAALEKIELESSLNQLQNEYNSKLVSVNEERKRIETEAQNREAELTARMEARTIELETEKTEAQKEIQRLNDQREQESLVENQILGFYKTIEDKIVTGELDSASRELKNLENYLYDESVINLSGITKRREVDLFVIDSLSKLIEATQGDTAGELDTMSLIDAADRLKEIQQIVQNADQQLAVGNSEMADLMYRSALEKIPEINRSHRFFLDAMESEIEQGYEQLADIQNRFDLLQKENRERRAGVSSLLTAADRTYDSGNFPGAIEAYKKALDATGFENLDEAAQKMLSAEKNIAVAPFQETINSMSNDLQNLQEEKERSLNTISDLKNELAAKALELESYSDKILGSEGDMTSLNEDIQSKDAELASMNDKLELERTEVVALKDQLEKQTDEISTYEQRLEELRLELESEKSRVITDSDDSKLIDRDMAELTTLKAQLNRLNKSYTDFELMAENLENNIQGDAATINALYDFFEEDSVEDVMPGISEYLRSFSSVYITAGTEIGLYEAVSLLYDLNSLETEREKKQLLNVKKGQYRGNDAMTEMINQIEQSLGGAIDD
ncbi:MAG: hypothetical protein JEY91_07810 [Spirochaetaceae bacterium]|nr:hypothetical protein [Spirochaetaceae bacterium]